MPAPYMSRSWTDHRLLQFDRNPLSVVNGGTEVVTGAQLFLNGQIPVDMVESGTSPAESQLAISKQ